MPSFWLDIEKKQKEFAYVQDFLKTQTIPAEGIKINRKDHFPTLSHSFLIVPEGQSYQLYALANKNDPGGGHLSSGFVKILENMEGQQPAVKIISFTMKAHKKEMGALTPSEEYVFLKKLGKSRGFCLNTITSKDYLIQSKAKGIPLATFCDQYAEKLSIKEKNSIVLKILESVNYLYSHDVVHRDLHENNIFIHKVGEHLTIEIIDFDFSRDLSKEPYSGFNDLNKQLYLSILSISEGKARQYLPFSEDWTAFASSESSMNSYIPLDPRSAFALFKLDSDYEEKSEVNSHTEDLKIIEDYLKTYSQRIARKSARHTEDARTYYNACHLLFTKTLGLYRKYSNKPILSLDVLLDYISRQPPYLMQSICKELFLENNIYQVTVTKTALIQSLIQASLEDSKYIFILTQLLKDNTISGSFLLEDTLVPSERKEFFGLLSAVYDLKKVPGENLSHADQSHHTSQALRALSKQGEMGFFDSTFEKMLHWMVINTGSFNEFLIIEEALLSFITNNPEILSSEQFNRGEAHSDMLDLMKNFSEAGKLKLLELDAFPYKKNIVLSEKKHVLEMLSNVMASFCEKPESNTFHFLSLATTLPEEYRSFMRGQGLKGSEKLDDTAAYINKEILTQLYKSPLFSENFLNEHGEEMYSFIRKNLRCVAQPNSKAEITFDKDYLYSVSNYANKLFYDLLAQYPRPNSESKTSSLGFQ